MERNDYVGSYAHMYHTKAKYKDAKYREVDNNVGRDAKYS